jgi:adenosylhomocysteine nucleosidase
MPVSKRLGIISAMDEEIEKLVSEMTDRRTLSEGMRDYHEGTLWGVPVILAFSRWGKVAAATTATHMIARHGIARLVFTGVAGGIAPGIQVGDVVIGTSLRQHDMDARPIFPQHTIPLLNTDTFAADASSSARLESAANQFLRDGLAEAIPEKDLQEFGIHRPTVHRGQIASGDRFFSGRSAVEELLHRMPEVLCVEMEGAAVAQVCFEYGIPFSIVRTISDSADEHAPINFSKFIRSVARIYSHGILRRYITRPEKS